MNTRIATAVLCLLVLLSCGCAPKVRVDGSVSFSDGSPLEKGAVMMSDGRSMYQGNIKPGGKFSLGVLKDGQGIPPGTYKVWITGVNGTDYSGASDEIQLIEPRFTSEKTSELSFEVKKGEPKPIDIVVEKPKS